MSILRLIPDSPGKIVDDEILFENPLHPYTQGAEAIDPPMVIRLFCT